MKIFVVGHLDVRCYNDPLYSRIWVGPRQILENDDLSDSTGDNIAHRNPSHAELTAIYWVWKNAFENAVGFCHYRRYFSINRCDPIKKVDLECLLLKYDIVVPSQRSYFPLSVKSHYYVQHYESDVVLARNAVEKLYPDYVDAFDLVFGGHKICLYNMFVCRFDLFDQYCTWIFSVLADIDSKIDATGRPSGQGRVFGFLSERLFNVWLKKNGTNLSVCYLPVIQNGVEEDFSKIIKIAPKLIRWFSSIRRYL